MSNRKIEVTIAKCPYCKSILGANITNEIYNKHLENCKPYQKEKEKLSKILEILEIRDKDPEAFKTLIKIWESEAIEEDLKKIMKKHKVEKERLIEVLESMME